MIVWSMSLKFNVELDVSDLFETTTCALAPLRLCAATDTLMVREASMSTGSPAGELIVTEIVTGNDPVTVPDSGMVRDNVPPLGIAVVAPVSESLPMTVLPLDAVMTAYPETPFDGLGRVGSKDWCLW